ncbi:melatonin receptor type 1B-B-like [Patiria miniata]|uniref:G-protein coupled receptors family 1 profile domain-containing protein n=1 Tax=Patiria miniata TaxID=46514 RepID=A0A914BMZ1_PATMI|nr:melatonin receptor type 1B-B-like [Patiria miniata]
MDLDILTTPSLPPTWEDENATGWISTQQTMLSLYSYPERVVIASFFILISVLTISGNITVILAVVFSKKLRTSTNVFVVSLAVADLLTGVGIPMSAVALLSPGDTWPFATEAPCFVGALLLYISVGASVLHLASIALNRAVLIKRPMTTYRWLYTRRNLAIMVVIIWAIAILVMLLPPLFDVGGFGLDMQFRSCSDLQTHPRGMTFDQIQTFTFYLVPTIVVLACYAIIFVHVRRHFKSLKAHGQEPMAETASSSTGKAHLEITTATQDSTHRHRISRQQLQITKNLFTAVCVFFCCITPFFLTNLLTTMHRFLNYAAIILLCNSCANPIIYGAKHPQFKKVMRRMIMCQYSQIEEPSDTLKALMACFKKQ